MSAQTFVPWIEEPGSGFVLSGKAWNDSDAIKYATKSSDKCDYVVITHLTESTNSWTASLRLVRIRDCRRVGELSESFAMEAPGDIALSFARQLLKLLQNTAAIKPQPLPPAYTVVTSAAMPNYLLRLEQLLATRCGAMDGTPKSQLSGQREILDGNIEQCLNYPQSISMRLLLAQTLLAMKQVRPDVLPEFAERIRLLQTEHSLVESAQKIVQELCDKAFET